MNFEGKQQSLLTFRVGPVLCCAPSLVVRSIITPPKLTHPPGSDASQPGIFKHGSHIVKALDLRQKFGVDKAHQTKLGNLIICVFEEESFAFWVDQILDVFDFPSEGWGNIPAAIPRGIFTRTLLLNKKIHLYSEFEKLATINDLGYLKHYIQQLQQQDEIKSTKKMNTTPASGVASVTSISTSKTAQSIESKKDNGDETLEKTLVPQSKLTEEKKVTSTTSSEKPLNVVKNTFTNKNTVSAASTHAAPNLKTSNSNATTTSSISKSTTFQKQANTKPTPQKPASIKTSKTTIKPITQPIQPKNTPIEETKDIPQEESSLGIIIFFFIILLLLGIGSYYLFFDESTNKSIYKKPIKVEEPVQIKHEKTIPLEKEVVELKSNINNIEEIPAKVNATTTEDLEVTNIDAENAINNQAIESETKEYKAEISQQDNEITIIVHQPLTVDDNQEEMMTTISEPEKIKDKIIIENTVAEISVETLKPNEITKPIIKKKLINEVIHTVVKGDTLWAIAKKYVKNPFLYPELARLSNIKNPHRIYPGNRVRIRFIEK